MIVLMRSRTSCAATLTSFSMTNVTTTCETPSVVIERSSSMPLMVLTASSTLSVISVSTSSGAAPGWRRDDDDVREVDVGEAIDAELHVPGDADDADDEDEHRREDRPLDAERGEPLHGLLHLRAVAHVGAGRQDDRSRPPSRRSSTATTSPLRLAELHEALLHLLARADDEDARLGLVALDGARRARRGAGCSPSSSRATANMPGLSWPSWFGDDRLDDAGRAWTRARSG